jgi:hypothetical protein
MKLPSSAAESAKVGKEWFKEAVDTAKEKHCNSCSFDLLG